jgi:hypothetical protein
MNAKKTLLKIIEFIVSHAKPFNVWMVLAQAIPLFILLGLFSLIGIFFAFTLGNSIFASINLVMPVMTSVYIAILFILWISESLSLQKRNKSINKS